MSYTYRPNELMAALGSDPNCRQLVLLARLSHKYQFRSIESWVLDVLHKYWSKNPAIFDALPASAVGNQTADQPSLAQVTELAALCERNDILTMTEVRWKRHIGEGKDLVLAISLGERCGMKVMLGLAYYNLMLKGRSYWENESTLSREQRIRLLSGYYSLGKLWDALPGQPPALNHTARCTSQQRCNKAWGQAWKDALGTASTMFPALPREDVLARIMLTESFIKALVESTISSQGFLDGIPHCRESALIATTMRMREIKESLADYFSDEI